MKLTLGPFQEESHFTGDPLSYLHADLLHDGEKVGSIHQHGYKPRWAFQISKFRHRYMWDPRVRASSPFEIDGLQRLLFDGAAWDTADEARAAAEYQLTAFLKRYNQK